MRSTHCARAAKSEEQDMKERFENTMGYLIAEIIFFYGIPLVCAFANAPGWLYNATPGIDICAALGVGFFFGKKHGGDWLMSIETAVVFIPCIFAFYNSTAWIYAVIIGLASLLSLFIGTVFKNRVR